MVHQATLQRLPATATRERSESALPARLIIYKGEKYHKKFGFGEKTVLLYSCTQSVTSPEFALSLPG